MDDKEKELEKRIIVLELIVSELLSHHSRIDIPIGADLPDHEGGYYGAIEKLENKKTAIKVMHDV